MRLGLEAQLLYRVLSKFGNRFCKYAGHAYWSYELLDQNLLRCRRAAEETQEFAEGIC
jgi:hypothetical protein